MNPRFTEPQDGPGFVVVDPVQGRRFPIRTADPVAPTATPTAQFTYPVDSAISIETTSLTLPYVVGLMVRDGDGELIAEIDDGALETFDAGEYTVDLHAPIKIYLHVEDGFTVSSLGEAMLISFETETTVNVGARSYHERPAGTITVTESIQDVMDALSLFGSALKTTSPERSFPTLRGHPPLVEFGDEFDVPEGMASPETGVTLELPPEPEYVLPAASLAYYLGADVVPESRAWLVTDDGFAHDLEPDAGFESEVASVLEQVCLLDCVVRTEGFYPVDLYERSVLESRVDIDFASLYDQSLSERLRSYLDIEFDAVEDLVPTWPLVADCRPAVGNAEFLPYAANELAHVRIHDPVAPTPSPEMESQVAEFVRRGAFTRSAAEEFTRSTVAESAGRAVQYVEPERADSMEQIWMGEGRPFGAGKLVPAGFHNEFAWEGDADEIAIAVVCNDDAMKREYTEETLYGNRSELPYDISYHENLTVDELAEVVAGKRDFLHYIGHIEDTQFVCSDGRLDARELDDVGSRGFLLNGCTSYDAGIHLVEAGSVSGIVTLCEVGNVGAIEIGKVTARLLNSGFSMGASLAISRDLSLVNDLYVAIGDTRAEIAQTESGICHVRQIEQNQNRGYDLTIRTLTTNHHGLGSIYIPYLEGSKYHITSGSIPTFEGLSQEKVEQFVNRDSLPVLHNGELYWPPIETPLD